MVRRRTAGRERRQGDRAGGECGGGKYSYVQGAESDGIYDGACLMEDCARGRVGRGKEGGKEEKEGTAAE